MSATQPKELSLFLALTLVTAKLILPEQRLQPPTDKQFSTDSQVSLSAADPTVGPSKPMLTVTASDIGQDYNLPSGTKFTIGE